MIYHKELGELAPRYTVDLLRSASIIVSRHP